MDSACLPSPVRARRDDGDRADRADRDTRADAADHDDRTKRDGGTTSRAACRAFLEECMYRLYRLYRLALLAALVFAALPAHAAELGEYQREIDMLNKELIEIKQMDGFADHGFSRPNEEAAAWMRAVRDLTAAMERDQIPEEVRQAGEELENLGEAYLEARRKGFRNAAELDAYEERIVRSRIRISGSVHYSLGVSH